MNKKVWQEARNNFNVSELAIIQQHSVGQRKVLARTVISLGDHIIAALLLNHFYDELDSSVIHALKELVNEKEVEEID
jgi:hypothetical protein